MKTKEEIIALFLENPYWREEYEEAPSDACRRYIEHIFLNSGGHSMGEASGIENIKAQMTRADWLHIRKYCGNNPMKIYCQKMADVAGEKEDTSYD